MLVYGLYEVQFVRYSEGRSGLSILGRFQSDVRQILLLFHTLLYLFCRSEIILPCSPPGRPYITSRGLTAEMIDAGVRYRKISGNRGYFSYL